MDIEEAIAVLWRDAGEPTLGFYNGQLYERDAETGEWAPYDKGWPTMKIVITAPDSESLPRCVYSGGVAPELTGRNKQDGE